MDVEHYSQEGLFAGELYHHQDVAEVVEVGFRFVVFVVGCYHVVVVVVVVAAELIHRQK